ncbi:MAG: hypothetical protein E7311_00965 [Clostridiales bacterium]|nr:hypothetical protein [Clostridiales bacterium]
METLKEILIILAFIIILVVGIFFGVKALSGNSGTTDIVDSNSIISKLEQKNNEKLNRYVEKYGGYGFGLAAYVLSIIQRYSIPICVLIYVVGAFYYYVISIKKFVEGERGYGMIVSSVVFLVIAQVAPLVFALIVTIGRS